jgi:glycine cleavage system protein P-like pyridoxal-binding family
VEDMNPQATASVFVWDKIRIVFPMKLEKNSQGVKSLISLLKDTLKPIKVALFLPTTATT